VSAITFKTVPVIYNWLPFQT